jgi:class 3 adenylate cyclase
VQRGHSPGIAQITAAPGAPAGGVRRNQRAGNVDNNRSASNGKRRPEGVHIGARVSALAGPNDVLVSSTLRDLVIGSGLEFEERGAHELKGVPGEWRLFAVAST